MLRAQVPTPSCTSVVRMTCADERSQRLILALHATQEHYIACQWPQGVIQPDLHAVTQLTQKEHSELAPNPKSFRRARLWRCCDTPELERVSQG
jgi:hypothetical protein